MRRLSILQRMPLAPVPYSEGDQHPAALPCWGRAMERGFFRNREGEFICRSNLGGTDSISACSSWFGFPQTPPCCRQHYQTPHPHCIPGILRQIFCFHLVTKVISRPCLNEAFTFSVKAPFPLLFFGLFHFISFQAFSRQGNPAGVEFLPGRFQEERPLLKNQTLLPQRFARPTFPIPVSLNPLD